MARGTRRREFDYTPPSFEQTVERADRQGSMYDNLFKGVKTYKAAEGRNIVRILPPTWKGANHYGFPIWVHYGIGPKEAAYLCLRENKGSPHKNCPLCEELYSLGARASADDRKALLPTQSIIYYILDRNSPQNGVMLWRVSGTADSEIAAQSVNRRKGSVLNIVDVDHGYDLEFMRSGQKLNTRYRGYQVVREDSPLTDDNRQYEEVLDYIFEKPLPETLNFYKPEHIQEVYSGKVTDEDEEEDRGRGRSRARDDEDEEEDRRDAPRQRSRAAAPPPPDDDDEEDEPEETPRPAPRRSRLAQEIDDEIPERPTRGRGRVQVDDDEEEEPFDTAPANGGRSRGRAHDDDDDEADDRRSRLRERLRRSRD